LLAAQEEADAAAAADKSAKEAEEKERRDLIEASPAAASQPRSGVHQPPPPSVNQPAPSEVAQILSAVTELTHSVKSISGRLSALERVDAKHSNLDMGGGSSSDANALGLLPAPSAARRGGSRGGGLGALRSARQPSSASSPAVQSHAAGDDDVDDGGYGFTDDSGTAASTAVRDRRVVPEMMRNVKKFGSFLQHYRTVDWGRDNRTKREANTLALALDAAVEEKADLRLKAIEIVARRYDGLVQAHQAAAIAGGGPVWSLATATEWGGNSGGLSLLDHDTQNDVMKSAANQARLEAQLKKSSDRSPGAGSARPSGKPAYYSKFQPNTATAQSSTAVVPFKPYNKSFSGQPKSSTAAAPPMMLQPPQ